MSLFILSTLFWGCTGDNTVTDCSTIAASKDKDLCFHDQVVSMNASQINEVITIAKKMDDAMIRGAAVAEWIKLYNNDINQQQGQELCKLLDGRDRSYCLRRLSSPHLKR